MGKFDRKIGDEIEKFENIRENIGFIVSQSPMTLDLDFGLDNFMKKEVANLKNLIEKGGKIEKYWKFHGKIGGIVGNWIH